MLIGFVFRHNHYSCNFEFYHGSLMKTILLDYEPAMPRRLSITVFH